MSRVDAYLKRANEETATGHFDQALSYERMAKNEAAKNGDKPLDRANIAGQIGSREMQQGNWNEALAQLEDALALRKQLGLKDRATFDLHHQLGICNQRAGNHKAALKCFEDSIELSDQSWGEAFWPRALSKIGEAKSFTALGRKDAAKASLVEAEQMTDKFDRDTAESIMEAVVRMREELGFVARRQQPMTTHTDGSPAKPNEATDMAAPVEMPEVEPVSETVEDVFAELDKLVGLDSVKDKFRKLAARLKVQQARTQLGLKTPKSGYHMVFYGPPGVGKTTVGRLCARLFHVLGIMPTANLNEVRRGHLVAPFVGQTAIKTSAEVDKSIGGVMLLDEAYLLVRQGANGDPFGEEASGELMARAENDRDKFVLILTGYRKEMRDFIATNPGWESRVSEEMEFDDLDAEQLTTVFRTLCSDNEYTLDEKADEALVALMQRLYDSRGEHFGNARAVRNVFDDVLDEQSGRLTENGLLENPTKELLCSLTVDDIANVDISGVRDVGD